MNYRCKKARKTYEDVLSYHIIFPNAIFCSELLRDLAAGIDAMREADIGALAAMFALPISIRYRS